MASNSNGLPADMTELTKHNLKTPPELFDLISKPLPDHAEASPGVYRTRLTLWQRFYRWIRPRRGCGCQKRKKWLNGLIPGLGDAVELITRWTGVKRLVDWWTS